MEKQIKIKYLSPFVAQIYLDNRYLRGYVERIGNQALSGFFENSKVSNNIKIQIKYENNMQMNKCRFSQH